MRPDREAAAPHAPLQTEEAPTASSPAAPALAGFERIVDRGRFTHLWALDAAALWEPIFAALDDGSPAVLEVGCFEGLWTSLVLWRLPGARITCIDTFEGGLDHAGTDTVPEGLEAIFDANVALIDASRVRKLAGRSSERLPRLLEEGVRFDLVYVDASHLGLDVLVDAAYAWQILRVGGYLVFDDYTWAELGRDALLRPGPAIDAFLSLMQGRFETVFTSEKLGIRKTA